MNVKEIKELVDLVSRRGLAGIGRLAYPSGIRW